MVQANIKLTGSFDISQIKSQISSIQKSLNGLHFKDNNLKNSINNIFSSLDSKIDDYYQRLNKGFKTKQDVTGLKNSVKEIDSLYNELEKILTNISKSDVNLKNALNIDSSIRKELEVVNEQITTIKKNLSDFKNTNLKSVFEQFDKLTTKMSKSESIKIKDLIELGDFDGALNKLENLREKLESIKKGISARGQSTDNIDANIKAITEAYKELEKVIKSTDLVNEYRQLNTALDSNNARKVDLEAESLRKLKTAVDQSASSISRLKIEQKNAGAAAISMGESQRKASQQIEQLTSQVEHFFGLSNAFNIFERLLRNATKSIQELDKAMTETAVVTDFSVGDMWEELPRYTDAANKLGTTTLGAYETMTLFYQQGLNTEQAFALGTETMKMARIAGMDYAKATDYMTAALRGFNMELTETSSKRINDVYSELAAITAADTEEIASAMTRTASIADSAGMEFETTSAFLAQMIETTREAPELAA